MTPLSDILNKAKRDRPTLARFDRLLRTLRRAGILTPAEYRRFDDALFEIIREHVL